MKLIVLFIFIMFAYSFQIMNDNKPDGHDNYYSDQTENVFDDEMILNDSVPKWLKGQLFNSCPSQFQIGKYKLGSVGDGFIRLNKYRFDGNGKVYFSSKLATDTSYYNIAQKFQVPKGVLSEYPTPLRISDHFPGANLFDQQKYPSDNIGVMPFRLPNNQSFVFTTDEDRMLEFDPETLSTKGFHYFNKSSENIGKTSSATTHLETDPNNGDLIGLAGTFGQSNKVSFYRIKSSDVHSRILIGSIPIRDMGWYHSFGITADYIVFMEHPISLSIIDMFLSKPVSQCFNRDNSKNSIVHVMKFNGPDSGKFTSYELDHSQQCMHFGNTYQEGNMLIFDMEMYDTSSNPFETLNMDYIHYSNKGLELGSKFRRYSLDLESGKATYLDILEREKDLVGFPIINPSWQGRKNCFTYISDQQLHKYQTSILKIDHCNNNQIIQFYEQNVYVQEPFFINNPNSQDNDEEDGVIVTAAYDAQNSQTILLIINPRNMKVLDKLTLKIRLPFGLHYNFFPEN